MRRETSPSHPQKPAARMPREVRLSLWTVVLSVPFMWSAASVASHRHEAVSFALTIAYLGALPCLAVLLFWPGRPPTVDPLLRFGRTRRSYVARSLATKVLTLIATGTILTLIAELDLYKGDVPAFFADLTTTLPICVATGIILGCFFGSVRAWLGRWGLVGALLLSWLTTAGDRLAIVLPLSHVRALLAVSDPPSIGGTPLPGWGSMLFLYAMSALLGWLLLVRVPR